MRRALFFFVIYFCIVTTGYGAPCYGTKMPEKKSFFTGLQAYSVFKRDMEKDYGKIRSLQNFFLLSYGIFDWLSLDLKGGAGNIKQRPDAGYSVNYQIYLGGGYGARLRLYDNKKIKMVFGFQHISVHPRIESVEGSKYKAVLDDWQFSFLVSHEFSKATPYIGTRWSRMDNINWIDAERKRQKSDLGKSIGLIIGSDIPLNKKVWFNVEGQFFDASAVAASVNLAF